MEFLNINRIILPSHQGGLKHHGTDTALISILNNLNQNRDKQVISCVLQTDLSSAFDMIDHNILSQKLEHYGVRGLELKLMMNCMMGRRQFVELDTFRSNVTQSLNCSVTQGSKLSAICYLIYTNKSLNCRKL